MRKTIGSCDLLNGVYVLKENMRGTSLASNQGDMTTHWHSRLGILQAKIFNTYLIYLHTILISIKSLDAIYVTSPNFVDCIFLKALIKHKSLSVLYTMTCGRDTTLPHMKVHSTFSQLLMIIAGGLGHIY